MMVQHAIAIETMRQHISPLTSSVEHVQRRILPIILSNTSSTLSLPLRHFLLSHLLHPSLHRNPIRINHVLPLLSPLSTQRFILTPHPILPSLLRFGSFMSCHSRR